MSGGCMNMCPDYFRCDDTYNPHNLFKALKCKEYQKFYGGMQKIQKSHFADYHVIWLTEYSGKIKEKPLLRMERMEYASTPEMESSRTPENVCDIITCDPFYVAVLVYTFGVKLFLPSLAYFLWEALEHSQIPRVQTWILLLCSSGLTLPMREGLLSPWKCQKLTNRGTFIQVEYSLSEILGTGSVFDFGVPHNVHDEFKKKLTTFHNKILSYMPREPITSITNYSTYYKLWSYNETNEKTATLFSFTSSNCNKLSRYN
ncbi:PIR Superfamily Protein [Plasmodium ovale wallikeri]|uniref:PIR Superfamily Protein n=1 Tax=Plasmodium ovale wallikeri TaxID=864142 RepID=A0A1A9ASM9_PLAOA|nr:PIR Superfamily Protein [Plasmodium ovale wallikeri]